MPRPRTLMPLPRLALLGALFLVLAGCGGERQAPPVPGAPSLRIVQPRPGQHFDIWDEPRHLGWVEVLFEVDDPTHAHRVRFRVGDEAVTEVRDLRRALVRKPVRGTHVLEAWLLDEAGQTVESPEARAKVTIHVGAPEDD